MTRVLERWRRFGAPAFARRGARCNAPRREATHVGQALGQEERALGRVKRRAAQRVAQAHAREVGGHTLGARELFARVRVRFALVSFARARVRFRVCFCVRMCV